jgi:hypothetical protein
MQFSLFRVGRKKSESTRSHSRPSLLFPLFLFFSTAQSTNMRASLAAALGKVQPAQGGGDGADVAALRALNRKRNLGKITSTVKMTKDVNKVLEDPPLPSAQDLTRWWPDFPERNTPSPLVSYGVHTLHVPRNDQIAPMTLRHPMPPDSPPPPQRFGRISPPPDSYVGESALRTLDLQRQIPPRSPLGSPRALAHPGLQPSMQPPRSPARSEVMHGNAPGISTMLSLSARTPEQWRLPSTENGAHSARATTAEPGSRIRRPNPIRQEPSRNFGNPSTIKLPNANSGPADAFESLRPTCTARAPSMRPARSRASTATRGSHTG